VTAWPTTPGAACQVPSPSSGICEARRLFSVSVFGEPAAAAAAAAEDDAAMATAAALVAVRVRRAAGDGSDAAEEAAAREACITR